MPLAIKLQHMRHDAATERDKLTQQRLDAEAASSERELNAIKEQARTWCPPMSSFVELDAQANAQAASMKLCTVVSWVCVFRRGRLRRR